jgi:hypothetical protein
MQPTRLLAMAILTATLLSLPSRAQTPPPAPTLGPDGQTLITLHLKDAAPEDAFNALAKQSGIRFTATPDTLWDNFKDDLAIDVDKKPFWAVVTELCDKTGLTIQQANSPRRIGLRKGEQGATANPVCISGAFMFRMDSANYSRSVQFAQPQQAIRQCTLQLTVYGDPNFKVLGASNMIKLSEALDDKGNSLLRPNNNAYNGYNSMNGNGNQFFWPSTIALTPPDKDLGTKITSLKGTLQARLQTKSETIEFTDLLTAKDVAKTVGDCTITLKTVKKTDQQIQLTVEATSTKTDLNRNGPDPIFSAIQSAQLLDDKDKPFLSRGAGGSGGGARWNLTLTFGKDYNTPGNTPLADPAKLIIEIPTEFKDIVVPLEFKDIPLP